MVLILLAGVLAASVAAAPAALRAQQPAATAPASGAAMTPAPMNSAEQANPEDENLYLHAPVVKTMARMLHLSLPVADNIFLALNFLILVLGIGIPLWRILPRMLHKRKEALSHSLEAARKMTEDAGARLSAVEAQLARFDEEIAAMRAHVEEDLEQEGVRLKASMEEESGRIVASAEQEIAAAAAHARRGLKHFAADLAIEQAARQLVLTPETDRAVISEFLRDTADGGRN